MVVSLTASFSFSFFEGFIFFQSIVNNGIMSRFSSTNTSWPWPVSRLTLTSRPNISHTLSSQNLHEAQGWQGVPQQRILLPLSLVAACFKALVSFSLVAACFPSPHLGDESLFQRLTLVVAASSIGNNMFIWINPFAESKLSHF